MELTQCALCHRIPKDEDNGLIYEDVLGNIFFACAGCFEEFRVLGALRDAGLPTTTQMGLS